MRFASVTVLEFASAALFPPHSFADFGLERIATGLSSPVYVTAPQGDSDRLFITELSSGDIKILDLTSNTVLSTPYVTISPPLGEGPLSQVIDLVVHMMRADFAEHGYPLNPALQGAKWISLFSVFFALGGRC